MPLDVEVLRPRPGVAHVQLTGELDIASAKSLASALKGLPDRPSLAVVDLSGLSFIDSSGLRALLDMKRSLAAEGGRLVLIQGPSQVSRVFEVTRLDRHFEIAPSLEQALAGQTP